MSLNATIPTLEADASFGAYVACSETVRDYLVSKGVPKDKIEALGLGEKQLVPGVVCEQKNLKEKIACLQPHRRVEIQAKGEAVKR